MSLLQKLLEKCKESNLIHRRSDMRTDATHVVASIRRSTKRTGGRNAQGRPERACRGGSDMAVGQRRHFLVLEICATLRLSARDAVKRSNHCRRRRYRQRRNGFAEENLVGRSAILSASLPAVETLRRCWIGQFWTDHGVVRWRSAGNLPPSLVRIDSPYDLDARYGVKRTTEWVGYKVHFTEICSPAMPHLITNVDTTAAHAADAFHIARGQEQLASQGLLPRRQFVDGSYMASRAALDSRKKHGIELVGPVKQNVHHTEMQSGYDLGSFQIDWEGHCAICPQGKRVPDGGQPEVNRRVTFHTKFSRTDCAQCGVNQFCIRNGRKNPRKLSLLPQQEHEWLTAARIEHSTPEWKQLYNKRAGIEGTFLQGVRSVGLR